MTIKSLVGATGVCLLFSSTLYAGNDVEIVSGSVSTNINTGTDFTNGYAKTYTTIDDNAELGVDLLLPPTSGTSYYKSIVTTDSVGANTQGGNITLSTDIDINGIGDDRLNINNPYNPNYYDALTLNALNDIVLNGRIYDGLGFNDAIILNLNPDTDAAGGGAVHLNTSLGRGLATNISGSLIIGATGVYNLIDAKDSLVAGSIDNSLGGGFNFTSGSLTLNASGVDVGANGLLGNAVSLSSTQTLSLLNDNVATIAADGSLLVNGGTFSTGQVDNSAGGTFGFNSGALSLTNSALAVDTNGLLGNSVALGSNKTLSVSDAVTIGATGSIDLSGGSLTAASIDNSAGGSFNFTNGNLSLTNSGLTVDASATALLGNNIVLGTGKSLSVSDSVTIGSTGSVELSGGSLSAGTLDNTAGGSFNFTAGSLNLNSGLVVGDAGPLNNTLALSSQMGLNLQNSNTLTIDATGSVAINGGSLVIGNIINNSASNLAFNSGTLVLNNSGLNVSENGLLGNTVLIDAGKTLRVESMTVGNGAGVTDIVNQTGGIVRTNSDLLVQSGGEYNISGGDLSVSGGSAGGITVNGNMNQTGGVIYGADTLTLGNGGTYVFDGGTLYVTNIDRSAGGTFVFNSGYLGSSTTDIVVDATGLLGDSINLTSGKELSLGMMTMGSTGSVIIDGGKLNLYDGVDNSAGGTFIYQSGQLGLSNYDLGIQSGGLLGASVTVNEGDSLYATNISVGNLGYAGVLNINGGSVSASSINIYGEAYGPGPIGEVNFNSGTLSVGGDVVHDGGAFDILKNVSNLDASKNLRVGGVLTLDGVGMTLSGGSLEAGKIEGDFNFNSGNLIITSDNLTIGSGGLLGQDVYFSNSKSLSLYGYNNTGKVNIAGDGKLIMNGGSLSAESIANNNKLIVNSGYVSVDSVDNNGTIRIEDGATMRLWNENTGGAEYIQQSGSTVVNGILDVNGVVSIQAGTISGSGTLNADVVIGADGALLPGNSPGLLTINGDLDMLVGSILNLEIESDGLGDYLYDQLLVSGEYNLQGSVQFSLLNGVDESVFGSVFDIGDFFKDAAGNSITDLSVFDNTEILAVNGTNWYAIDFDAETGGFISTPTTSPVPVPAAAWLFGSGLIGLISIARRRKV